MVEITILVAFIGGLVSFLSPCMLPIIPTFLTYLAGVSLSETKSKRKHIFLNSLFFVLGFSVVFAILGILLNTILQAFAYDVQVWLARIGGIIVIFFGLYLVGLIEIPFLEREYKFKIGLKVNSKYFTSFLFGAALAAGWTPCVGVAFGSILGLAAIKPGLAFYLLLSYSLGLGVPFLIVGLFTSQASNFITNVTIRHSKVFKYINIVFGTILIILGIFAFTQNLNIIANFGPLNRWLSGQ
jgi:cytochrome c-type biogenesis protein